jgi:hypothetical protein
MPKQKNLFKPIITGSLTVIFSVLIIYGIANAGSLTPPALPAATSYTLADIYTRLTTNAAVTEANHLFAPSATPAGTLYTLKQIYDAIPTVNPAKILASISYLGITGTYNISNLTAANVKSGTTYGTSSTGTLLPNGGTATTSDVCLAKTYFGASQNDWNARNGTLSVNAANIATSTSYCGVSGTLLGHLFNSTGIGFAGGSQINGGVDDYNNATTTSPATWNRYVGSWTKCNAGSYNISTNPGGNYCNTGLAGAYIKDNSTGLVWSNPCKSAGCAIFSSSSPSVYTWTGAHGANNWSTVQGASSTASGLCANGDHLQAGWYLPTQKQLMMTYIDGAYGNLEALNTNRSYWSATTRSEGAANAWYIYPSNGGTYNGVKTGTVNIRCVR